MGFFDYVADIYSALSVTEAEAEERQNAGPADNSGQQADSSDTRQGGVGTAEHDRGAAVKGGASTSTAHSGTNEESDDEKEVNAADAEKANSRTASSGDDGPEVSRGSKAAPSTDDDEEEAEDEEEEEDEDEPSDPKPKLEEECLKSSQCHSYKHHYDECAERVQQQIDDNGKASEDCVEEYFHMMHCATQCSAAKLFKQLR